MFATVVLLTIDDQALASLSVAGSHPGGIMGPYGCRTVPSQVAAS
jgi:hypothetical protein